VLAAFERLAGERDRKIRFRRFGGRHRTFERPHRLPVGVVIRPLQAELITTTSRSFG
jgi:hypothetical protein